MSTLYIPFRLIIGNNTYVPQAWGGVPLELKREDAVKKEYDDPEFRQYLDSILDPIVLAFRSKILTHSDHICAASPPCGFPAVNFIPFRISFFNQRYPHVRVRALVYCGRLKCEIAIRETFEREIKATLERATATHGTSPHAEWWDIRADLTRIIPNDSPEDSGASVADFPHKVSIVEEGDLGLWNAQRSMV